MNVAKLASMRNAGLGTRFKLETMKCSLEFTACS